MKRAFFVIGPEGCGTYMLAEAFVSAGCTYCDKDEVFDFLADNRPDLLVLRRSLPHAGMWPNLKNIEGILNITGYKVEFYSIIRDSTCAYWSVAARRGISYDEHLYNFGMACTMLTPPVISYEYFVLNQAYRKEFFNRIALPEPEMEFYDGNKKYYK